MSADAVALESIQRWMQQALIFPRRVSPDEVAQRLAGSPRLAAAAGLAIYQRGYFLRIASCMRAQFPALCHALEAPLFDDFVADYIRECPPESHTLYDLGRRFPDFLEASRPDRDSPPGGREAWIDFMVDLARFERAVFVMFDAPGCEGMPLADAATPDEALRLQTAFALGAYRYPVAAYYHEVREKRPAPIPAAAPCFVALVRTGYVTRTVALDAPQYRFLEAMTGGGGIDDGIAAAARELGASPDTIRSAWRAPNGGRQRWIGWGFFVAGDQSS